MSSRIDLRAFAVHQSSGVDGTCAITILFPYAGGGATMIGGACCSFFGGTSRV
jgi:hypothetical protein